jgi:type II secretory pathway pseudopilin PulG
VKQCQKCSGNLADFGEVCPYCGTPFPPAPAPQFAAQFPGRGPQSGAVPENSGKALASLICGVVFFFWPFSAIAAVILGHLALADIKRSAGRLTGRGLAIGGLVTGYIGASLIFLMIVAAIAIPNLLRARIAANEASAIGSLGTYNTAMATYSNACPDIGYPASLESLGPGSRDCSHLDVVSGQLAAPFPARDGYCFAYTPLRDVRRIVTGYQLSAVPIRPGRTGARYFFADQTGVIRARIGSPRRQRTVALADSVSQRRALREPPGPRRGDRRRW